MTFVYTPGCWDLLHVGHVKFLEGAASLGDRLIVGVPSDDVVLEDKGVKPIIPLSARIYMVSSLRCVHLATAYYQLEFLRHLRALVPDVFVIGEHWGTEKRHHDAEDWCMEHGCRIVRLPYSDFESTTKIKERIRHEHRRVDPTGGSS